MIIWLQALGFAKRILQGIIFCDIGDISDENAKRWSGERKRIVFLGDTSPEKVVKALDILKKGPKSSLSMKNLGYRNACAVLYRFRLLELTSTGDFRVIEQANLISSKELIWNEAGKEKSISIVKEILKNKPKSSPEEIGRHVSECFSRKWKESSYKRVGNALRQWTRWILTPLRSDGSIPKPPGRKVPNNSQSSLFDYFDYERE